MALPLGVFLLALRPAAPAVHPPQTNAPPAGASAFFTRRSLAAGERARGRVP